MDLSWISIIFTFIFSIAFSLLVLPHLLRPKKEEKQSQKRPPGSTGLPLIGETLDFLSASQKGIPEKFAFDRMKKYSSNVIKTSLFGEPMALFCGPEASKFIFSNEAKLVESWKPRSMHILFDGYLEMVYRKGFSPKFSPYALQRYVPIFDFGTKQHLQTHWEGKDVVMVHPLAKLHSSTMFCRLFLGIEDDETVRKLYKLFAQIIEGIFSIPVNIPGTNFHRAIKAKEQMKKELDVWIKKWKTDYLDGRLSEFQTMLADILKEDFDDDTIFYSILALLIGAFDTTSDAMTCVVMFMGQFPHVYERVLAEQREIAKSKAPGKALDWEDIQKMKYSWNVARESLRLHSVSGMFKEVISEFTYDGFLIPKGWKVQATFATHKNPEYFKNPEKFDPTRFEADGTIPYSYIPFGGGPRMCPGKEYARIQILVFIHNLIIKYRWEQIFANEKIVTRPMFRPAKGLLVRLYAQNS